MPQFIHDILLGCIGRILRPIARLSIRHSVKFREFTALAKRAFLEAAEEELEANGLEASVSRLSILTGLQRRDVTELSREEHKSSRPDGSLIARIIGQWSGNRRFLDSKGAPRPLAIEGRNSEFAKLVRSISTDPNSYAVLFELERIGVVKRENGCAVLVFPVYTPSGDIENGFGLLARDMQDLITAVSDNVLITKPTPNLHFQTEYDNISTEDLPKIQRWLITFGQRIHRESRAFLSKFDRDISKSAKRSGSRARVVFNSFSLSETLSKGDSEEN